MIIIDISLCPSLCFSLFLSVSLSLSLSGIVSSHSLITHITIYWNDTWAVISMPSRIYVACWNVHLHLIRSLCNSPSRHTILREAYSDSLCGRAAGHRPRPRDQIRTLAKSGTEGNSRCMPASKRSPRLLGRTTAYARPQRTISTGTLAAS